jgi:hypothetical protein
MNLAINISDKHVSFETFVSITDVKIIRFLCETSDNKVLRIRNIKLLTPTYNEYTIRTTEEIQVKIINYINEGRAFEFEENKLFKDISDDDWIDENSNINLEDGIEYKFFRITPHSFYGTFNDFLEEMFFQRAKEDFENRLGYKIIGTIIAMFLQDSIIRSETSNYSYIKLPMTSDEIDEMNEFEERKKELREIEDEDNYDPIDDADSWMDDPENYWNID